ncbi:MAG: hypothetical protein AB7T49_01725 [Oligoflexales bacterium]
MSVIKKNPSTTRDDLLKAIAKLVDLLKHQDEDDAIEYLEAAATQLKTAPVNSAGSREAVKKVIDAFEGDHELMAYTMQRETDQWTEAEELSQASSRVISLARRMRV